MSGKYAVGIDIGGTKCAVVLGRIGVGEELTVLSRFVIPTETRLGPQHALGRLQGLAHEILDKHRVGADKVAGIGICCGGPLDGGRGVILSPPNLPGWDAIPIVDLFRREFGVPVKLQNDADACAIAEWRYGAGRGVRNMVFCTFGTGFGAGLILDGRLYTGASGLAGEIGHVRLAPDGPVGYGKRGSVEGFCSGSGIVQLARAYVLERWQRGQSVPFCATQDELDGLSAQRIGEAARAGDLVALEIWREVGCWLGRTLAILVDVLNPELIVLGGIFTRQQELLWTEAEGALAREALAPSVRSCRVAPAALGERIGDYASLAAALY